MSYQHSEWNPIQGCQVNGLQAQCQWHGSQTQQLVIQTWFLLQPTDPLWYCGNGVSSDGHLVVVTVRAPVGNQLDAPIVEPHGVAYRLSTSDVVEPANLEPRTQEGTFRNAVYFASLYPCTMLRYHYGTAGYVRFQNMTWLSVELANSRDQQRNRELS